MRFTLASVILYAFCSILLPRLPFLSAFETTAGVFFRPWDGLTYRIRGLWHRSPRGKEEDGPKNGRGTPAASDWWSHLLPPPGKEVPWVPVGLRLLEGAGAARGALRYYAGPRSPVRPGDPVVRGKALVGFIRAVSARGWVDVVPMNREGSPCVRAEVRGTVAGEGVTFVAGGADRMIPGHILIRVPASRDALVEGSAAFTVADALTPGVPDGFLVGFVETRSRPVEHGRDVALLPPYGEDDLHRVIALVPPDRGHGGGVRFVPYEPLLGAVETGLYTVPCAEGGGPLYRVHAGRERGLLRGDLVTARAFAVARLERVGWFVSTARPLLRRGATIRGAVFPPKGGARFFSLHIDSGEGRLWSGRTDPPLGPLSRPLPLYLVSSPVRGLERYPVARLVASGTDGTVKFRLPLPGEACRCLTFRLSR